MSQQMFLSERMDRTTAGHVSLPGCWEPCWYVKTVKKLYHLLHLLYRIYNYSSILILQHRYLISFIASTLLYLLLQWCIINPRYYFSDRCAMSGKIFIYTTVVQKPLKLYLRQVQHVEENFVYSTAVARHQNCDRCTMAGTYSIYYSGIMYPCHCIYDSGQPNLVKMPY